MRYAREKSSWAAGADVFFDVFRFQLDGARSASDEEVVFAALLSSFPVAVSYPMRRRVSGSCCPSFEGHRGIERFI